jgi:MGT family glycosyltransferase
MTLEAAGNWPPEIALIRALVQRGHEVRVISGSGHAKQIAEAGAEYRPYRYAPQRDTATRYDEQHESEMARVLREVFLNPVYGEELLAEVDRDRPDVLLVDHMLMLASAAAETTALPTAVLWHTVFGAMAERPLRSGPAIERLNGLRAKWGLAPVADQFGVVASAQAILAFTYGEFDTAPPQETPQLHYVGPLACLPQPPSSWSSPWPAEDPRPLILVSYSTSFQRQVDALQRVADAVEGLPVRVLLTLGNAISAEELSLPDNVVAEPFVPHISVLPQASLVVTHAGHGTVMAATTAGVPMLCVPMGRDQHVVGACVERRGLGLVASVTISPAELRNLITAALDDAALRERARGFAARLDVEAGLVRAIDVLENLRNPAVDSSAAP